MNFRIIGRWASVGLFVALCQVARGQYVDTGWQVGAVDADWFNAANWTLGVPTTNAHAWINDLSSAGKVVISNLSQTAYADYVMIGWDGTRMQNLEIDSDANFMTTEADLNYNSINGHNGSLTQKGGNVVCRSMALNAGYGSNFVWTISGGSVTASYAIVSTRGFGTENGNVSWNIGGSASVSTPTFYFSAFMPNQQRTLTQTGGQINVSTRFTLAESMTAVYNFVAGTLNLSNSANAAEFLVLNGATVYLGDSNTAAGVFSTGPNQAYVYFVGDAKVIGWGTYTSVGGTIYLGISGTVIADGYGSQRNLDFSGLTVFPYGGVDNTTTRGMYAVRGGRLKFPSLPVSTVTWGQNQTDLTFVNCVRMANVVGSGNWTVDLLSADRSDVTSLSVRKVIGVWEIAAPSVTSVNLNFRYDNALAASLNLPETNLKVYHAVGGNWVDVTSSIDTANHRITASGLTTLGQFAVGIMPPRGMIVSVR